MAFVISGMIHAGLIYALPGNSMTQAQYRRGNSAVEFTLMPSMPANREPGSLRKQGEYEDASDESEDADSKILLSEESNVAEIPISESDGKMPEDTGQKTSAKHYTKEDLEITEVKDAPEYAEAPFDSPNQPGDIREEGVESGVEKVHFPRPEYPRQARRLGYEGSVSVIIKVDEEGSAVSAEVISSSGYSSLDDAALKAAMDALFVPAKRAGIPVSSKINITYRFLLKDRR